MRPPIPSPGPRGGSTVRERKDSENQAFDRGIIEESRGQARATASRLIDRDEAARKVARVFHERQELDLGNDGDLARVFEECAGFPIDPRWLGQLRTAVVNRLGEVEL